MALRTEADREEMRSTIRRRVLEMAGLSGTDLVAMVREIVAAFDAVDAAWPEGATSAGDGLPAPLTAEERAAVEAQVESTAAAVEAHPFHGLTSQGIDLVLAMRASAALEAGSRRSTDATPATSVAPESRPTAWPSPAGPAAGSTPADRPASRQTQSGAV